MLLNGLKKHCFKNLKEDGKMLYQIIINPSATPCFTSRSEFLTRVMAKLLSFQHHYEEVSMWNDIEKKFKPGENPTKLIGFYRFGKYINKDWRSNG